MQMTQEHRGTWEPTPVKQNKRLVLLLLLLLLLLFCCCCFSLERALLSSFLLSTRGQLMPGAGLNPNFELRCWGSFQLLLTPRVWSTVKQTQLNIKTR